MNHRTFLLLLAVASLAACDDDDKKKRLEAMGAPKPSAPPPWASSAASASATPPAATSAAPPVKLTGTKALRDRLLGGKWYKQFTPAQEADNKAELEKAEKALKDAKSEPEKRAAKARKMTVEEVAFTWTEFSAKKRTTKAPPNRLVLERPYEVLKEDNNVITIRVWDEINPQGGPEIYTFLDDNTVRLVQGDSQRYDTLVRKLAWRGALALCGQDVGPRWGDERGLRALALCGQGDAGGALSGPPLLSP